ncbi:hypothetical protein C1646_760807 [Rhizophagus diaphanus]|nr:hypothetical protein C1646_760807 [Rhizophagus diaphanus] [Rhizophagus sp. MUCL 43196]
MGCAQHSWYINKHNIQVSCIGQYGCEALKECNPLCVQAFDNIKRSRSICCSCYEKLGGHIYQRPGRGKKGSTCVNKQLHLEDISSFIISLSLFGILLLDRPSFQHQIPDWFSFQHQIPVGFLFNARFQVLVLSAFQP